MLRISRGIRRDVEPVRKQKKISHGSMLKNTGVRETARIAPKLHVLQQIRKRIPNMSMNQEKLAKGLLLIKRNKQFLVGMDEEKWSQSYARQLRTMARRCQQALIAKDPPRWVLALNLDSESAEVADKARGVKKEGTTNKDKQAARRSKTNMLKIKRRRKTALGKVRHVKKKRTNTSEVQTLSDTSPAATAVVCGSSVAAQLAPRGRRVSMKTARGNIEADAQADATDDQQIYDYEWCPEQKNAFALQKGHRKDKSRFPTCQTK